MTVDNFLLIIFIFLPSIVSARNCTADPDSFLCSTGKCIPKAWTCDNTKDCEDGGDESESICGGEIKKGCAPGYFQCGHPHTKGPRCARVEWKCDGFIDCAGGVDEANCTKSSADNFGHRPESAPTKNVQKQKVTISIFSTGSTVSVTPTTKITDPTIPTTKITDPVTVSTKITESVAPTAKITDPVTSTTKIMVSNAPSISEKPIMSTEDLPSVPTVVQKVVRRSPQDPFLGPFTTPFFDKVQSNLDPHGSGSDSDYLNESSFFDEQVKSDENEEENENEPETLVSLSDGQSLRLPIVGVKVSPIIPVNNNHHSHPAIVGGDN